MIWGPIISAIADIALRNNANASKINTARKLATMFIKPTKPEDTTP